MPAASTNASTPSTFLCSGLVRHIEPVAVSCASSLGADTLLDLGPVPLPGKNSMKIERLGNHPQEYIEPATSNAGLKSSKTLSVSCFPLTLLSPDRLASLLAGIQAGSSVALLADFKVAERNIEVPSCLLMAGIKHLCRAKDSSYAAIGGLEGLLYREGSRFRILERHTLLGGALTCILVECQPGRYLSDSFILHTV